jgi:alpha-1,3-rhamnosyl/mannosyltransferase
VIRVGVNLLWLVPGEVGGSEEYTIRLLDAWADDPPDDVALTLLVGSSLGGSDAHADVLSAFDVVAAPTDGANRLARVGTDTTWLPRQRRAQRFDLLHHAGGTVPFGDRGPNLLTVHDLQPFDHPGNFRAGKRRYLQFMMPRSVRQATRIATLTAFVAHDVQAKLGAPAAKFVRVPPGYHAAPPANDDERAEVRARHRLLDDAGSARPFFLYPAITYPHKNHVVLVHAFAELHRRHPDAALVLTGGAGPDEPLVQRAVERLGLGDAVRRTGRIPARDLEVLYEEATALTFASRYEGCGNPVLEAMSARCPVIASDCTGLVETVGDAGTLVGPQDVDGWAKAMEQLLTDEGARTELIGRGVAHVATYDWATSAQALADAYRAVMGVSAS